MVTDSSPVLCTQPHWQRVSARFSSQLLLKRGPAADSTHVIGNHVQQDVVLKVNGESHSFRAKKDAASGVQKWWIDAICSLKVGEKADFKLVASDKGKTSCHCCDEEPTAPETCELEATEKMFVLELLQATKIVDAFGDGDVVAKFVQEATDAEAPVVGEMSEVIELHSNL